MFSEIITFDTNKGNGASQGLNNITDKIQEIVSNSGVKDGMCNLFVLHTSCSLCIQENHDPDAAHDLETFMNCMVPFQEWFRHVEEGKDDMPSHIKAALNNVSLSIPVIDGKLAMGRWQGIYLWEHRDNPLKRSLRVTVF